MPERTDPYSLYLTDGAVMPSPLLAYLPAEAERPGLQRLVDTVRGIRGVTDVVPVEASEDHSLGGLRFSLGTGRDILEFELDIEYHEIAASDPHSAPHPPPQPVGHWCIYLGTYLGEQILEDFHTQLKILHALAPDAIHVHDYAAARTHSGWWLRDVVKSNVPPSPDSLYTVHAIHDDDRKDTWLHSHGLHRCGSLEIEMLGVPAEHTHTFGTLFNTTAALWIEHGPPDPDVAFEVGQDIHLMWKRWEDVIPDLPRSALGGREDRDEYHDGPSGILFAAHAHPRTGAITPWPISSLLKKLEDEPMLFLTHMETQRMSLLAKHRFPKFRSVYKQFKGHEDWFFQVKMGYMVDDCPEDADENEHLWFDVRGIRNGVVTATLLNEPYNIARMREGDTGNHPVDQLSDWCIDSPFGHFDANSIGHLEDLLEAGGS